jgi:hypothetical protein
MINKKHIVFTYPNLDAFFVYTTSSDGRVKALNEEQKKLSETKKPVLVLILRGRPLWHIQNCFLGGEGRILRVRLCVTVGVQGYSV